MNLTSDPWIPIVWEDGRAARVSLEEAFRRGHEIRDLAVRPHERIALMRLLICIAQAALDGPKDRADWRTCAERLPALAVAYLERWRHAFELFGDGQRFLQVSDLRPVRAAADDEGSSVSKLDSALACGNNTTLFDNAGGSDRSFASDQLALMLLTYQCFSPCGIIGATEWAGISIPKATARHAPCTVGNMLHTIVKEQDLLRTIGSNLLTREQVQILKYDWGSPVWEDMPLSPKATGAVSNATTTYLGRLCPLSRLVRLGTSGEDVVLGNGLAFGEWREPTATMVIRDKAGQEVRQALGGSVERAVWRELHSVTVLDRSGMGGPLALLNSETARSVDIWAGALVAKGNASVHDVIEASFSLPSGLLQDWGQTLYREGVGKARDTEWRMKSAIKAYCSELRLGLGPMARGASYYWTAVEQHVSDLLAVVDKPELLRLDGVAEPTWSQTAWGKAAFGAARAAYELACPHQTPRQMRAYALGLRALFREPDATADVSAAADTDREDTSS